MPGLRPSFRAIGAGIDEARVPEMRSDAARQAILGVRGERARVRRRRAMAGPAPCGSCGDPRGAGSCSELKRHGGLSFVWRATALAVAAAVTVMRRRLQRVAPPNVIRARAAADRDAGRAEFRAAATVGLETRRAGQLDRTGRRSRHAEVRRAHGHRLDRRANHRVGPRLVRQLGRCPVGPPPALGRHRRALAAEERGLAPTPTTCGSRIRPTMARRGRRRSCRITIGTQTEHGFASLFPMGDGFGLVWLDGRAMKGWRRASARPSHERAWRRRDERPLRAIRQDLQADRRIRRRCAVCECCPTAAAVTAEGVITAYRNRSDEEIRDNYVARLVNGKWSAPQPVFNDNWKIAACPVNGPALSAPTAATVAMTWFTVKKRTGPGVSRRSRRMPARPSARRFASMTAGRSAASTSSCCPTAPRWRRGSSCASQSAHSSGRAASNATAHGRRPVTDRRHRRQPRQRLPARGDRQRRGGVRVDRICRWRRLAGPHRRGTPSLTTRAR